MMTVISTRPITIFTPSVADEDNTNAQNLTVKEVVARLPENEFLVVMLCQGKPDPRIAGRKNTKLVPYTKHGNTLRLLWHSLFPPPDIYFFSRCGPLDRAFFDLRKYLHLRTALVSYIVMAMDDITGAGLIGRSIVEADQVCANSEYVASTVREKFGVESVIVYDAADRRFFFPAAEKTRGQKPIVVLYAGSFQPRKRVELVVQQAARWPSVQFRLAGRGETLTGCQALAEKLGRHNVSFIGHVSAAQLGEEMRQSDIFLFPSILEGHPQVLGQAAACGLPAIAMNIYRPEYVLNGKTGFLVESDSELAGRLDLLLNDTGLRTSMAAEAARHSQKFNWDQITKQWAEIFRSVVRR